MDTTENPANKNRTTVVDPRVAAIQKYLRDERAASRWVFSLPDEEIVRLLDVADRALAGERVMQVTREITNG